MSLRIECVHNPQVTRMTEDEFNEQTGGTYEGYGDAEILVLSYDEAVTIEGDLEQFARDVWTQVFGSEPSALVTEARADEREQIEKAIRSVHTLNPWERRHLVAGADWALERIAATDDKEPGP